MPRTFRIALLAAAAALMGAGAWAHDHTVTAGSLEITHPWSRATPGGAKVAAGYVAVANKGAASDRLVAAEAAGIAGRTEIHEVSMTDGVMRMKLAAGGLEVPAGGTLTLKPGSYHLMFMDLKRPLKQGETFPGSLTFEKAGKVPVDFTVEALGAAAPSAPNAPAAAPGDHGGMDHGHMGH